MTWHELICREGVGRLAWGAGSFASLCREDARTLVAQCGFITELAQHH